jgi:4'-phosphopantetheinyl transferase
VKTNSSPALRGGSLPSFDRTPCDALLVHAATDALLEIAQRDAWWSLLSPEEQARHARFHFAADQRTFLVAHGLVRRLLGELTGSAPQQLAFAIGEHGRPELSGPAAASGVRFNLSHTRGRVACAFTRGADVGVDVEETGRDVRLLEVAERVYSDAELESLRALDPQEQRRRFFELWTLKEAYIKAIGKGFSAPLRAITFHAQAGDPVPLSLGADISDVASSYACRRFAVSDRHALAIVWRGADPHAVRCFELTARDF